MRRKRNRTGLEGAKGGRTGGIRVESPCGEDQGEGGELELEPNMYSMLFESVISLRADLKLGATSITFYKYHK